MSDLVVQERERLEARRAPEAGISVYCGALRRRERLQAMVDELPPEQVVVMAESGLEDAPLVRGRPGRTAGRDPGRPGTGRVEHRRPGEATHRTGPADRPR